MKKLKESTKIIIGMVIGLILSTVSYVVAETLINSKDVVYEDNSNLMADNVQEAIDGTCSKIDTRLAGIEDKLYMVKNMSQVKDFTTSTSSIYTGLSITFPAKSYCGITIGAMWRDSRPEDLFLSNSNSTLSATTVIAESPKLISQEGLITIPLNMYFTNEVTYYVWARYNSSTIGGINVSGFCATKYK